MFFVTPPYKRSSTKAFYVRKGQANRIKEFKDLEKLKIGTALGAKYFEEFDQNSTLDKQLAKQADITLKSYLPEELILS